MSAKYLVQLIEDMNHKNGPKYGNLILNLATKMGKLAWV